MEIGSVLRTAFKILFANKIVWLFSLLSALLAAVPFSALSGNYLQCLIGILALPAAYLTSVGRLGVNLALYHGYLGQPAGVSAIWKESNSYVLRYIGLALILAATIGVPYLIVVLVANRLPFILYRLLTYFAYMYFLTFPLGYLLLNVISSNSARFKAGAALWVKNTGLQLLITLAFCVVSAAIDLLSLLVQRGTSLSLLFLEYNQALALIETPVSYLLSGIRSWAINPVFDAIIVVLYMTTVGKVAQEGSGPAQPETTIA